MTSDALGSAKRRDLPASGLDQSPKLIKEAPESIEHLGARCPDRHRRHLSRAGRSLPLCLSAGFASRYRGRRDGHDDCAARQGCSTLPHPSLGNGGHSGIDLGGGNGDCGDISRPAGCGLDCQGPGNRDYRQREILHAQSGARRVAGPPEGLAAIQRQRSRRRDIAVGHGHAGARGGHACCHRAGALLRNVDLLPRGADRLPPLHGFVLHHTRGQAASSGSPRTSSSIWRLI